MKMKITPELRVQMDLLAHEKECAIRYQAVDDRLRGLDKRMWRLEAMSMASTFAVIALIAAIVTK
jgi:hypothetical protein